MSGGSQLNGCRPVSRTRLGWRGTHSSGVLREEGGFHYKKAIVDTLLIIIGKVPEAKEAGLAHLCEFIEDCEFTLLSTQILHLLGVEASGVDVPVHWRQPDHRFCASTDLRPAAASFVEGGAWDLCDISTVIDGSDLIACSNRCPSSAASACP